MLEYGDIVQVTNDDGERVDFEVHYRITIPHGSNSVVYAGTLGEHDEAPTRLIVVNPETNYAELID